MPQPAKHPMGFAPKPVAEGHHRPQDAPQHRGGGEEDVRQPVPNFAETESVVLPDTHNKLSLGNATSKAVKQSGGEYAPAGYSRPGGKAPGTGAEKRDGE